MDRSWIDGTHFTPPYMRGVDQFMGFVRQHFSENEEILCPCRDCLNLEPHSQANVMEHITCAGMSTTYTRWIYHGEALSDYEGDNREDDAYLSDDDDFDQGNGNNDGDDVPELLDELFRSGRQGSGQPNLFAKLMEEAKKDLYEGCYSFTRLSFIIKVLHIKSYNRITNRAFNAFIEVISMAFPHAKVPKSYNEAKKALREVGLGYETIHVCKFDCALFRGDHANSTHCPVCGTSRWKDNAGRKKIPWKILRYFPIIPRLQRFFVSKELSADARWHMETRVNQANVMRHPADGEAWKHFDREFDWFAGDARNILGTLLEIEGKNKDTISARVDLKKLKIREGLHMKPDGKQGFTKPKACYTLNKEQKKKLCEFLANVKFPDGFAANLSRCVDLETCKVHGLKTHDCHILLQRVIPAGLRGLVRKDIYEAIAELGNFFRELCSKTLTLEVLHRLEDEIPVILCKLERIFPPAFFDIMVHLAVHLPEEAILRGLVHYGWMYPVEIRLGYLKGTVRNKAKPEGSIAEAYVVDECLIFCSRYLNNDIETRFNKADGNKDGKRSVAADELQIFSVAAKGFGSSTLKYFENEYDQMVWYVLNNVTEVEDYVKVCREELLMKGVINIDQALEKEFPRWFEKHIQNLGQHNVSEDLYSLASGPDKRLLVYSACNANGARYLTLDREKNRRTQNSGIMSRSKLNGVDTEYYGVLREVIELQYPRNKHGDRSAFLFRCDWFDLETKRTGMRDDGYFKSVNMKALRYKNDPFLLASQAFQAFYMEDTRFGNDWRVVQTFSHRHVYDVPEAETGEPNVAEAGSQDAYQEDISSGNFTVSNVDPLLNTFHIEDEEGTCVDANIVHDLEKDENHYDENSASDKEHEDDTLSENGSEHSSDEE